MVEFNQHTVINGRMVFHKEYCLYIDGYDIVYDRGDIKTLSLRFSVGDHCNTEVRITCSCGEVFCWETKWISSYTMQFGVAVSFDGRYVFAQTWENGLFCFDVRTGEILWRTKSRRGITSIFVNEDTILCCQRECALQLLDIHTGDILLEKRPFVAWEFTALDHRYIVCQVTARRWELIDAQTLETAEAFTHKVFTGGHEDYCINKIELVQDGRIKVFGFKNIWDNRVSPAVMLPNLEFEHYVDSEVLRQY